MEKYRVLLILGLKSYLGILNTPMKDQVLAYKNDNLPFNVFK